MSDQDASAVLPLTILTGFLGSGKTTLLNRLLPDPALADALVLVNEFGEVGLDHHLVSAVEGDIIVLSTGCICCNVQSELAETLTDFAVRRHNGEVSSFRRVVVETTGLADPAPIVHMLMEHKLVSEVYSLDGVIATVDAWNGASTLDRQPEAVKQVAVADRLVLTKTDLASAEKTTALARRLRQLNPAAPILNCSDALPAHLLHTGLYNPETKSLDAQRWLASEAYDTRGHHHDDEDSNRHDAHISALCLTLDEPVDFAAFALWAQSLATYRGDDLLRLKAIVNARGQDRPIVVHGVQHLFHAPIELPAWPSEDRRSRIVLITRNMSAELLRRSLATCQSSAD